MKTLKIKPTTSNKEVQDFIGSDYSAYIASGIFLIAEKFSNVVHKAKVDDYVIKDGAYFGVLNNELYSRLGD